ncbi:uncharacterized protein LOC130612641 [Hydractinia symbiolongicarpus]|uniref:uncharacterized protein LOC130612641 n=1 Tax=Hydractinia symbiolongicarpus TaxID=13093 RepID=UPI00254A3A10|nr:uncharacterized protein LOC130612641 [Hydractinia symbiolongicarpus]
MNMVLHFTLILSYFYYIKAVKNQTERGTSSCLHYLFQTQEASSQKKCFQMSTEFYKIKKRCFKEYRKTCSGPTMLRRLLVKANNNLGTDSFHYLLRLHTSKEEDKNGCWGALLNYKTTDGDVNKCMYKKNMKGDSDFIFSFYTNKTYALNVTLLPTGNMISTTWTSPSHCQLSASSYIGEVIAKKFKSHNYCFNKGPPGLVSTFAKMQCEKHGYNQFEVINMLTKQLQVTSDCRFRLVKGIDHEKKGKSNQETTNQEESKDHSLTITFISVSILFILLVSAAYLVVRYRRKSTILLAKSQDCLETQRFVQVSKSDNGGTSVMILNRPGCELLEEFLCDFAFVLSSYGISVKMALLEQNEIDADGGIASYMQKHINKCDYILIMCTENTNEKEEIIKHRPYEFALKIIGGLAFHQNDSSRYIPMYLSSYKESVNIIPSFLNASTSFGYQLPQDMKKLLLRITTEEQFQATSERTVKDEFFINRMNEHRRKIITKEHPHCIKEYCTKGTNYGSIVNLSSLWPTTDQSSKWSTFSFSSDDVIKDQTPHENVLDV